MTSLHTSLIPDPKSSPGSARAQVIAAWALIITAACGGIAGIITAVAGAKKQDLDVAKDAIVAEVKSELEKDIGANRERIEDVADWVCEANEGPPHVSWPCYHVTWNPPPRGTHTPLRTTSKPWPR